MSEADDKPQQVEPPPAATPAPSSPAPAGASAAARAAGLDKIDAAQLAELAGDLDWKAIDLECPGAFAAIIGAEPVDPRIVVACDCGTKFRMQLDGETMTRCPGCKTVFRHVLVVQADDADESGASLAVQAILDAQR